MSELNTTKRKILLLLLGGATLSLTRSPKQYFRVLKAIGKEWKRIRREELRNEIRELYKSKLVGIKTEKNSTLTLVLNNKGKIKALRYQIDNMKIKPQNWDGRWRLVIFDIPEEQKPARDALRFRLKKLGLHELQKSVFISPFKCKDEIDFITEFYQVRPYVRYGILESIDNELHLKIIFGL